MGLAVFSHQLIQHSHSGVEEIFAVCLLVPELGAMGEG